MATKDFNVTKIHDATWKTHGNEWHINRLAYNGGDAFIKSFLVRHKAESFTDFRKRTEVTYNPATASAAVDSVMGVVTSGLWKVDRTGHDEYVNWVGSRMGGSTSPIETFISTSLLPEYSISGTAYVLMDAPLYDVNDTSLTKEDKYPYCNVIPRENIRSVSEGVNGIKTILYVYYENNTDNIWGLPCGVVERYMYWHINLEGKPEYIKYDAKGKEIGKAALNLSKIPIIKSGIRKPIMTDISKMQIGHMNLASNDINFLVRSNVPLYAEQYDPKTEKFANKFTPTEHNGSENAADLVSRGWAIDDSGNLQQGNMNVPGYGARVAGVGSGVRYPLGMEAPQFINPSPECVKVSIDKQDKLILEVKNAVNASVASITRGAVMQSAASKKMDEGGELRFSEYISFLLESFEYNVAKLFYEFQGLSGEPKVSYPVFKDTTEGAGVDDNKDKDEEGDE